MRRAINLEPLIRACGGRPADPTPLPTYVGWQQHDAYIAVAVARHLYITDRAATDDTDTLLDLIAQAHGSSLADATPMKPDDLETMFLDLQESWFEPTLIQFP
jgi:hypothetical protein